MDEDEARDEIEAAQMHFEVNFRKTIVVTLLSIGFMIWLALIFSFNGFFYDATHTSLFPGISVLTLFEVLGGFILYWEFDKWAGDFVCS